MRNHVVFFFFSGLNSKMTGAECLISPYYLRRELIDGKIWKFCMTEFYGSEDLTSLQDLQDLFRSTTTGFD